ncbi:hypothetical protein RintRC_4308 [Richelia intracellularis]|nr:hypothetical protein RintRC_4308 [Richelia intracellularis]
MKRRTFLQRFGSLVAAMGLSQAEWLSFGERYYQALAQPSPRKFALLVGINKYSQNYPLGGCVTDVELQTELLVHRFGFSSSNILALTDEQASRDFIEDAFLEHLVKQAKSGDVVVFHFSGYGCQVETKMPFPGLKNALVTVANTGNKEDYLLEDTLQLLVRSLATNRVTMVLDSSYSNTSNQLPSGWLTRVCQSPAKAAVATEEAELQAKLTNQLAVKNLLATNLPISLLTPNYDGKQVARELMFSDCSVGLFTYTLTQYLWETAPTKTIQVCLSQVANSMYRLGSQQQPHILSGTTNQQQISESLLPSLEIGAEGVIQSVEEDGKTVNIWLGGIPAQVVPYYDLNSQFSLVGAQNKVNLVLRSPLATRSTQFSTGLSAKAEVSSVNSKFALQPGQLIQEKIRVIPRDIGLTVALGTQLERIERVDATSAFSTLNHVSSVIAGEQRADFVFGKLPLVKVANLDSSTSIMASPSHYGLFSMASVLIPNTMGEPGEAVKIAVQRLAPKVRTLKAAKLWRLTENAASSQLAVKVKLEIVKGLFPRIVAQQETRVSSSTISPSRKTFTSDSGQLPNIPVGSRIQYRVQNLSERPIYVILLGLDTSMNAYALYPWQNSENADSSQNKPVLENTVVAPGKALIVPSTTADFQWVVTGPTLFAETQLILSTAPFKNTLEKQATKHHGSTQQSIYPLLNPVEVAKALLEDIHNASNSPFDTSTTSDFYSWNVKNWASFSFIYQVV